MTMLIFGRSVGYRIVVGFGVGVLRRIAGIRFRILAADVGGAGLMAEERVWYEPGISICFDEEASFWMLLESE